MADIYVDTENGSDVNGGTSFADALKGLAAAFTASSNGDTIKVAKNISSNAVAGNFTADASSGDTFWVGTADLGCDLLLDDWNSNYTVHTGTSFSSTLDAYTGALRGGPLSSPTLRYASSSSPAASTLMFSINLVAELGGVQDWSAYESLVFNVWADDGIGDNSSGTADVVRLAFCSDTAGATVIQDVALPIGKATTFWADWVKLDFGGPLPSNISSLAIYTGTTTMTGTFQVGLTSIYGVKPTATCWPGGFVKTDVGGHWYKISAIVNGATPNLYPQTDSESASADPQRILIDSTAETFTFYSIPPIVSEVYSSTTGSPSSSIQIADMWDGVDVADRSDITWEGGYNTSTNLVDGYTGFSWGRNALGQHMFMQRSTFTGNKTVNLKNWLLSGRGFYSLFRSTVDNRFLDRRISFNLDNMVLAGCPFGETSSGGYIYTSITNSHMLYQVTNNYFLYEDSTQTPLNTMSFTNNKVMYGVAIFIWNYGDLTVTSVEHVGGSGRYWGDVDDSNSPKRLFLDGLTLQAPHNDLEFHIVSADVLNADPGYFRNVDINAPNGNVTITFPSGFQIENVNLLEADFSLLSQSLDTAKTLNLQSNHVTGSGVPQHYYGGYLQVKDCVFENIQIARIAGVEGTNLTVSQVDSRTPTEIQFWGVRLTNSTMKGNATSSIDGYFYGENFFYGGTMDLDFRQNDTDGEYSGMTKWIGTDFTTTVNGKWLDQDPGNVADFKHVLSRCTVPASMLIPAIESQNMTNDQYDYWPGTFISTTTNSNESSNYVITPGWKAVTNNVNPRTAGGLSWQVTFYAPCRHYQYFWEISQVACAANLQLTATAYVYLTSIDQEVKFLMPPYQNDAAQAEQVATSSTATIDDWQALQIVYTPTINGVFEFQITFQNSAIWPNQPLLYVDDFSFVQA